MSETWYLRTGVGAACGPGTQRPLLTAIGAAATTQDITTENTWNRTESARTIQAGDWLFTFRVTTGSGGGAGNRVTAVIERRNNSCVVQETLLTQESGNLTAGAAQDLQFSATLGTVTFNDGDILTIRIVRTAGSRTEVINYNGASPSNARLVNPDVVPVPTPISVGGNVSSIGTLTKQAGKETIGGIVGSVGQVVKNILRVFTGSSTPSASIVPEYSGSSSLYVELREGVTVITSRLVSADSVLSPFSFDLTQAERDAITNWNNLRVTYIANGSQFRVTRLRVRVPESAFALLFKTLVGAVASSGIVSGIKLFGRVLTGSVASVGSVLKNLSRSLVASVSSSGTLSRQILKSLSAVVTSVGNLVRVAGKQQIISGTVASVGGLNKAVSKFISGTVASVGSLNKAVSKFISGSVASVGSLSKAISKFISGTVASIGSLSKAISKFISGSVSSIGSLSKRLARNLSGLVTSAGTIASQFASRVVTLSGTVISAGSLSKTTLKRLLASVASTGAISRLGAYIRSLSGSVASQGILAASGARQLFLAGQVAVSGLLTRLTRRSLAGIVAINGSLNRAISKTLTAIVNSTGRVVRGFEKTVNGIVESFSFFTQNNVVNLEGFVAPIGRLAKWISGLKMARVIGVVKSGPRYVGNFFSKERFAGTLKSLSTYSSKLLSNNRFIGRFKSKSKIEGEDNDL